MLNQVFDPNNLFWRIIAKGVDIVGLSLFWAFLCLPVITVVPATVALYEAVVRSFRKWEEDDGAFTLMIKAFIKNLKRGLLISAVFLIFGLFFSFGYSIMKANWGSNMGAVMFVAFDIALLLPAGVVIYTIPLLQKTQFKIIETLKTACVLAIKHLPSTVVCVLLNMEFIIFTIERWFPILFAPVVALFLSSLFLEKIFLKYMDQN